MATKTNEADRVTETEKVPFEALIEKRGVAHLLYVVADLVWSKQLDYGKAPAMSNEPAKYEAWGHIEWTLRNMAAEAETLELEDEA